MFKKTMKFDDLDGNEVTQTFYFNYNKKEVAELIEFGQLEEKLAKLSMPIEDSGLTQVENNQQAYDIFQDLILNAYGVKGEDNVTFRKTPELREYWKSHVAFVELIFEFLENPPLAAEFIEKCLPAKLVARAKEEIQAENAGRLSSSTIAEMVQEADRRQQDPATRIEPGMQAAQEAGVAPVAPPLYEVRKPVVPESEEKKDLSALTKEDIKTMSEEDFKALDIRKLDPEQMLAAFERKAGEDR